MAGLPDETDLRILVEQDTDTLLRWGHQLNEWGWPDGLPNPELDRHKRAYNPKSRGTRIREWIEGVVGSYAWLHFHNVIHHGNQPDPNRVGHLLPGKGPNMTNEEFERWWREKCWFPAVRQAKYDEVK